MSSRDLAVALMEAGVDECTVTEGWSVCRDTDNDPPTLEPSCILDLYRTSKEEIRTVVWPLLRGTLPLTCAHIFVFGGYSGCIHGYLGPSPCPHDAIRQWLTSSRGPPSFHAQAPREESVRSTSGELKAPRSTACWTGLLTSAHAYWSSTYGKLSSWRPAAFQSQSECTRIRET